MASGNVSKNTGASTTLAATPQVAAGVDFTSGAGVEASGTSVVHFNTAAQVAGEWSGIATVEYNDSGTAMLARPAVRSIDINGTTRTRLVIRFSDPTTGAAVAITTATIGAGKTVLVRFQGFVN